MNRTASHAWLLILALAVLSIFITACWTDMAGEAQDSAETTTSATANLSSARTALPATTKPPSPGVTPVLTSTRPPAQDLTTTRLPPPTVPDPGSPTPLFVTSTPRAQIQTTSPSPTAAPVESVRLPPEDWKLWPVIPQVPLSARELYQQGLTLGNDPHAFSILGDCQSLAETFMGVYETDPALVASLPPDLQATVANFTGSFNRASPTVKGGTTAGAVLWDAWHENQYTCQTNETPLDCELRLHKPSIVIINLGTHYETRNIIYLRKIMDRLTSQGIVPILATKADNRELDERLNQETALLAVEYDVPLWNFWAAVSDLPNNGVGVKKGEEFLGEIYLSDEGLERHRYTALQALAAVWMAVK
jgi:hypothetical protein